MTRKPGNVLGILFAGLLLVRCVVEDRQAGTSTTVGNTVAGIAVLADGTPAAGAGVSLRTAAIRISRTGVPTSRLLAFATADSAGAFTLPRSSDTGLYLEAIEAAPAQGAFQRDSLEILQQRLPQGLPDSGRFGSLRLAPPGGLSGRLMSIGGTPDSAHWIGAQGTDDFIRVKADGTFQLNGLSAGPHVLVVIDAPDVGIGSQDPGVVFTVKYIAAPAPTITVTSGQVVDLGSMLYFNRSPGSPAMF